MVLGRWRLAAAAVVVACVAAVGFGSVVGADPADTGDPVVLFVSSDSPGSVGGVAFEDEDILAWDSTSGAWSLAVDGSAIGIPASADINAVHVFGAGDLATATVLMSFQAPTVLPLIGSVDDSDVVAYDVATGLFTVVLDGSLVGLTTSSEDIDAMMFDSGDLVLSTVGGASVPAPGGSTLVSRDEDLLVLVGAAFELYVDGSDIGLSHEDISGATIDEATDELFLATLGVFNVPGLSGDKDDIPVFTGTTGDPTSGTLEAFFDGDDHGFGTEQVDAVHIFALSPPPPGSADLSITKDDDVDPAQIGDVVTYTVEVTNNSATDASENVVVTDTLPAGTSLVTTVGCAQDPNGLPCTLGTIAPGASKSYTIEVSIDSAPPGVITNTAVVSSGTADPVSSNNSASEDTLIVVAPSAVDDGPASNSVPGDDLHTPASTVIDSPSLTANDDLGAPAATVSHFGGGDLGGSVTDNPAGASVAAAGGTLSVDANGDFSLDPGPGFDGLFSFQYRLKSLGGTSDATVSIFVGDRPATTSRDMIWVSSSTAGTTGGVAYNDEDIIAFDAAAGTWSMVFDGSDVGLTATDINALHIVDPNDPLSPILMSFQAPISVSGLGTVDDADVVEFTPILVGTTTAGSFSKVFDGSDNALGSSAEDIDAISLDDSGALLLSTIGGNRVPAAGGGDLVGRDEDLLRFDANLANYTMHFDGSDVDLAGEDLVGAYTDPVSGRLYGAGLNGFIVPSVIGDKNDVFSFSGTFGDATSGTYNTFFDGHDLNLSSEQIDGLHVVDLPDNTAPVANPDRAATDENTPITIGPDYTTSISSPGGDISKIAIDPRTGHYVVLGSIDGQTRVQLYDPVNRRVLETETLPGVRQPVGVDFHPVEDFLVVVTSGINEAFFYDEDLQSEEATLALDFQPRSVAVNRTTGDVIIGGVDVTKIYDLDLNELLHTIEHEGLVASGLDIHERTGEIVAVLYEDQGAFAPGQIQWWDADGQLLTTLNSVDTNFPFDLSIDQATGDFAVPNNDTGDTVTVFDENGNSLAILGGFGGPRGVAFDPATGNLAVVRSQGWLIDATTGALIDGFFDEWTGALAVQPTTEGILAASSAGGFDSGRFSTLSPTTRNQSAIARGFVVDVATDPTSGRIAVLDGAAVSTRQLEIYDPTGTTLLHSMTVPGASVAFHPDTGAVAVSLRTGVFRLYDPTLTTQLASFPLGSSDSLGVQPGTGNIVARFGLSQAKIFDPTGSEIGLITSSLVLDVAVDPFTGNIAIAGPNTGTEIWDPTGTTLLDTIPTPLAGDFSVGVAFGGTGNLVIAHDKSGSLDVMARGLLANDADPDGDPLTVSGFDATSAHGAAVTVNPDGSFTYDPTGVAAIAALRSGETLADTFTYTIDDGNGETDTATATVFVAGVNDAPQLSSSSSSYAENLTDPIGISPASDDSDSTGNGLTYSLIGAEDDDLFSIDPVNGDLSFLTPPDFENPLDANADNQYRVSVGVRDSEGSSAAAYVSITVTDVADTGSITIVQDTDPNDGQLFSYVLSPVVGGVSGLTLDDDGDNGNGQSNTQTLSDLPADTYTVTQTATAGWGVADITCTGGTTTADETTRTATIVLAGGDDVTCTFTNQRASDVSVSLSATPDPVQAGSTLTYQLGFSVAGFPAGDPVLTLDLPAGVTYVGAGSFDSLCSEATPGVVTCDLNGLWAGLNAAFEVTVGVGTVGPLTATGSVTFTGIVDPNLSNNTTMVDTTVTPADDPLKAPPD